MSCEKASRRLRFLLSKAKRLGLNTDEVVELPGSKRLLSPRMTSATNTLTILAMITLILAGGIVFTFLCAPCLVQRAA